VDPQVAATAVGILRGVVGPGGTGFPGRDRPADGRQDRHHQQQRGRLVHRLHPQLATSVWVGDAHAQVPMGHLFAGGPVFGGTFPALIFHDYMAAALAGEPVADLPGGPPGPRRGLP
jgi:penicillin-binding protein 1A